MNNWLNSVYSDGTDCFVSIPCPKLNDKVKISIRFYQDSPIEHVYLHLLVNGTRELVELTKDKTENPFIYYSCEITINQPRLQYHFILSDNDTLYFYNQKEISTFFVEPNDDFVLIADYDQPSWVKESVFYQIFPERFNNGNPDNDVQAGEIFDGSNTSLHYDNWDEIPLDYEHGHCLDFYGGDLEGITQKIPYLKDLGITALYLNPIFEAPSVHKYDCIDYFKVDEHFGGDKALEELSKACHKNGIKLILDISINHTGRNHIWFNRDGIFYDKSIGAYNNPDSIERNFYFFNDDNTYKAWWNLDSLPTLNYTSEDLKNIVYKDENSVLKKWLKPPYNIDGWRFDVADVFARNNELQLAHDVWPEIRDAIKSVNKDAYILAEDWEDCAESLQGNEWDSAMNYFGCARIFRQFVGAPELMLERRPDLAKYQMKITAAEVRKRIVDYLAKMPFVLAENQFNLLDSHDVSRLHTENINMKDYQGAVIFQFTLIGAPSIYYGDEIDIGGSPESNETARYPMPWKSDFENSKTFKLYKTLAHLKTSIPALKYGGMKFIYAKDDVLALARLYKDSIVLAIMSKSDNREKITLDLKQLGAQLSKKRDLLNQELSYKNLEDDNVELELPEHSSYLIELDRM